MEKLILRYHIGDGYTFSFEETAPIEFSSKDDLQLHIWDVIETEKKKVDKETKNSINFSWDHCYINILGNEMSIGSAEHADIYTLDEWFEKFKSILNK